jgi:TELO2-interacting protein 1
MVMILKKLTAGAMLSHTNASEEFRIGIIKSFKAMLLRAQPCSDCCCLCKKSVTPQTAVEITHSDFDHANNKLYSNTDSQECLVAFLQSPDASAAVGHWLSLLLEVIYFLFSCHSLLLFLSYLVGKSLFNLFLF